MSEEPIPTIRVFISSPGDLHDERKALKASIEALSHQPPYQGRYQFSAFIYETDTPDVAAMDWQQRINLYGLHPARADVVVAMLWSRLGVPLANFINPITGRGYRSGTEYEISTAYDAQQHLDLPKLFLYHCSRAIVLPSAPESQQLALAQAFLQEVQEERMVPTPVPTFTTAADLCAQVCVDIEHALPDILDYRTREHQTPIAFSALPALPIDFVPREHDLTMLGENIVAQQFTVLHGLPGQGKTVQTCAICDRIGQHFPDGILWATVGRQPDLARIQREWIVQLHGNLQAAHDVASAHEELLRSLGVKAVLLVLDDVWQARHAQLLTAEVPATVHVLCTSRNRQVMPEAVILELGPMERAASRRLIELASKGHVTDPTLQDTVAERVGQLPLAMKIIGALLARRTWDEVSAQLASNRFAELATGQRNIYLSLDASVQSLTPDQQARYKELSIFPPQAPLERAAVARLWRQTGHLSSEAASYLLTLFQSQALIQSDMRLHDLQRDYMTATTTTEERQQWHNTLIGSYGPGEQWGDLPDDDGGYGWQRLAWHLAEAKRAADLRYLLLDATYLEHKIARFQTASVLADCALLSADFTLAALNRFFEVSATTLDRDASALPEQVFGRQVQIALHTFPPPRFPHVVARFPTLARMDGPLLRTLQGHTDLVRACAFSPDGQTIVSGSADATLKLWDAHTGQELRTLSGHTDSVNACAFSPDGRTIVSGSADTTLKLWDAHTGQELRTLRGHTDLVLACAVSPDGQWIVSGGGDGTLRLWDAQSGQELRTLQRQISWVTACAFSPGGQRIVSGANDGTLTLWDAKTGQELRILQGHADPVVDCAFGPDGRFIISSSWEFPFKLWDAHTGQELQARQGEHTLAVNAGAVSPDGQWIASGGADGILKLWDAHTSQELRILQHHTRSVNACAFSPDGRTIVSGSADTTLKLWNVLPGHESRTLQGHTDLVRACAFSPDGQRIVSSADDGTLTLWDAKTGQELHTLHSYTGRVRVCAFSPDGRIIISGANDGTLTLWDAKTGQELWILQVHAKAVVACAVSPDGQRIISGGNDGALKLWDAHTYQELHAWQGHTYSVHACAFSPDGQTIVSNADDNTLKLWDAKTSQELRTLRGHTDEVNACAFSLDGRTIVSGADDNTLKLWDAHTGQELRTLRGHTDSVNACAFSPDGLWIVSGAYDNTLKLWDVQSGQSLATWYADYPILCCALHPFAPEIVAGDTSGALHFLRIEGISWQMPGQLLLQQSSDSPLSPAPPKQC